MGQFVQRNSIKAMPTAEIVSGRMLPQSENFSSAANRDCIRLLRLSRLARCGCMQPGSSPVDYWNQAYFRLVDAINAEMWVRSPQLQLEIQHPHSLFKPGSVGPQQAMLEPDATLGIKLDTVLPWVPDIVGKEAEGDRAVLIYGSAYAGFIWEYSC